MHMCTQNITHTYIIIQTFILSHQQRHNNSDFHPNTPTQPHTHIKLSTWTIGAYMDMHTHNYTDHTHIGKLLCIWNYALDMWCKLML